MSERNGESGAIACDERNDEWNQKNAGISGEINVMRQFDSSPNSEKGDRTDGTGGKGGGDDGEKARKSGSREYYRLPQSFAIAKLLVPSRCLLP